MAGGIRKHFTWLPVAAALVIAACSRGSTSAPGPMPMVSLYGRVSFDRVPFKANLGGGLDFAGVIKSPARGVTVEVVDSVSADILASTTTNENGVFNFAAPGNRDVFLRVKAQMLLVGSGASWNFRVRNNTNGDALYVLDGAVFRTGDGSPDYLYAASAAVHDLHAASGWTGAGYTATRAAAPFAILDTVYQAKELLLSAQPNLSMPTLDLYWSASNRPATPFCPSSGNIVSTAYQQAVADSCVVRGTASKGIYIQGDFANGSGDTDEFDQSVIAHEFGHYVEYEIGRSDSIGGSHGANQRMDLRVAMSEGWGNAFSAMVRNDPIYRDSFGGSAADTNVDIESGPDPNPGWYSETTVQQILWDAFDTMSDSSDALTLGFTPIFQALAGPQRETAALAGLHSFAAGLKSTSPSAVSAIDALLTLAPRNITGVGEFAAGETNSAGEASVLPLYGSIALNQPTPVRVCSTARFGSYNHLGNRKFFRLDLNAPTTVTIKITAEADPGQAGSMAAVDPDAVLWRQGARVWVGSSVSAVTPAVEQSTPLPLQSGTYILEVYEYLYANPANPVTTTTLRCMKVTATG